MSVLLARLLAREVLTGTTCAELPVANQHGFPLMSRTSLPWWVGNTPGGIPGVYLRYTVLLSSCSQPAIQFTCNPTYVCPAYLYVVCPWQKVSLLTEANTFDKCKVSCGVSVCGFAGNYRMLGIFYASFYVYSLAAAYSSDSLSLWIHMTSCVLCCGSSGEWGRVVS